MTAERKLHSLQEVIPEALMSTVLHLKGEKAQMAVGSIAAILGLLMEAELPPESIPSMIRACEFVRDAVRLVLVDDPYKSLFAKVENTLADLKRRTK